MDDFQKTHSFRLADYSGLLAEKSLTDPSAREQQGKFMLLERPDALWLIMGSVNVYGYHADLLAQFCRDHDLIHEWIHRPANLVIRDRFTTLHGGGWVHVEPSAKRVTFSGRSTAYGRFDNGRLSQTLKSIILPAAVTMKIG